MGERNWRERYHHARHYADEQAASFERGDIIENWRQVSETDTRREKLTGASWVAWAYEIAMSNADALVQTQNEGQRFVEECTRLMEEYRQKATLAQKEAK